MAINKSFFLALGPLSALLLGFWLTYTGTQSIIIYTACITLWTAVWWVSEALPIPVTSILPFVLLPFAGVITYQEAASALGSHVILLLMAAFILSKALEASGVHERLALKMVTLVGGQGGARLVFAFMATAVILSMWISNTATVLMLIPIGMAITSRVKDDRLTIALLLGIAYSSSVGGVSTLIGTPPNVIFAAVYQETTGTDFIFLEWMKIGVPISLISLPLMALWLGRGLSKDTVIEMPEVGNWRPFEKRVLIVFFLTVVAWITRTAPFGGWGGYYDLATVGDSTIALGAVIVMFLVPNGEGGRLLKWETAVTIPWGMLLLFAGGIVLAKGFTASGLSTIIGASFSQLTELPVFVMMLIISTSVIFLTEITSNTATATLLMPVLAAAAIQSNIAPELLMIPAAIAATCAFMLPVATAPNAIVFATEKIPMRTMAKEGFVLNIILTVVIASVCYFTL